MIFSIQFNLVAKIYWKEFLKQPLVQVSSVCREIPAKVSCKTQVLSNS